jgi:sugar transferase EpsL
MWDGKRILDLTAALLLTLFLGMGLILVSVIILISLGRPIFFRQERPGIHGRSFTMYKFRTMSETRHEDGSYMPDEQRLTRFGRFLRRMSLDELPQLFNVIRGDMSLVGPRPMLTKYLQLCQRDDIRRFSVKPGITGWAQVNGRNDLTYQERFACDLWYVDNHSFSLDLKILFMTVSVVLGGKGACGAESNSQLHLNEDATWDDLIVGLNTRTRIRVPEMGLHGGIAQMNSGDLKPAQAATPLAPLHGVGALRMAAGHAMEQYRGARVGEESDGETYLKPSRM